MAWLMTNDSRGSGVVANVKWPCTQKRDLKASRNSGEMRLAVRGSRIRDGRSIATFRLASNRKPYML
jgi:hypothetical protein